MRLMFLSTCTDVTPSSSGTIDGFGANNSCDNERFLFDIFCLRMKQWHGCLPDRTAAGRIISTRKRTPSQTPYERASGTPSTSYPRVNHARLIPQSSILSRCARIAPALVYDI
mmetsp:Transcript_7580/g.10980  ORF Transcript_7580/g.10980 Transcript_7580/m.10980 type:complete len:113 (-) Transcript_7580:733-1071(-)